MLLAACGRSSKPGYAEYELDDLRGQLDEARYAQHAYRTELELLEDRLERQDKTVYASAETLRGHVKEHLNQIEGKLTRLDQKQQQILADLRQLSRDVELKNKQLKEAKQELALLQTNMAAQAEQFRDALSSVVALTKETKSLVPSHSVYRVQSGDTLGDIAAKRHTTIHTLKELNELRTDRIYVGQKIRVPSD